ncbi:RagB/SusD family nutrient uptake outer membrane protein [Flavobacteriaceae bacterium]|nr:RagB/SusD family nutrient uptake outer membrane protein [Flavobacteriaceae bacterium]
MKNYKKYFLGILSVFTFVIACTDLEEELVNDFTENLTIPGVTVDAGETSGSSQSVSDGIGSAFSKLRDGTAGHNNYWAVQTVSSDEMQVGQKGGDWYDGGIWLDMHMHVYTAASEPLTNTYNTLYNSINEVNNNLSKSGLSANEIAQLRVLRALFYGRLMDVFGNVKIVKAAGSDAPQSNRADVFAFVESEILAALGVPSISASMDLTNSDLTTNSKKYRINQYAAVGLLSRIYLNAEVYSGTARYAEAAAAAGWVIDNGPYQLTTESNSSVTNLAKRPGVPTDPDNLVGYPAMFAPNNQDNVENIWTVPYDGTNGGGMNFHMMGLHQPSQFAFNLDSQPWNGYQTLEAMYRSFESGDVRGQNNFLVGQQYSYDGLALSDWAADDLNADGTKNLPLNYTPEINELYPNSYRQSGARMYKFSHAQFERNDKSNDFPIIRLSEMYMNRAEGLARAAGDWSQALPDVNIIRERAKVSAYSSVDAAEFLAERGREFVFESLRRTDLIRFGKYNDAWFEKTASESYKTLMPIPTDAITASGGSLTQNPGY